MPKTRKFIDRKHAVVFHLVHRSQQDPLAADETAPQRVLIPVRDKKPSEAQKRKEEQLKYGIFFDDDYNYLQHLRDTNSGHVEWEKVERIEAPVKLKLPSSVFASTVEEDVGLLNKAAPHTGPRPELDPDIVAAMDEDFDYSDPENELEDDFIQFANAEGSGDEEERSDFGHSEEDDEVGSLDGPQYTFADEETKSRFTEYSMSSSVMRRNEQLTLLDDRFEQMYAGYDDNEIGALDCEEIEGHIAPNSEVLLECAEEFEKQQKLEQLGKDEIISRLQLQKDEEDENLDLVAMEIPKQEQWDCESILSTYSNIYNRPKLITEPCNHKKIKINKKTGMPVNVLNPNKLTAKALSQLDSQNNILNGGPKSVGAQSIISTLSILSIRPKNESPEDRRQRKHSLKEYRKARREEKKANTIAFKEETKRQTKTAINNKNNVHGNRIL